MELLSLCGAALTAVFAALALKKYSPETAAVISLGAGVMIFVSVLGSVSPLISEISRLTGQAGIDSTYGTILFKTVGVCAMGQFTADLCRDNGQSSLASRVELAARLSMLLLALPMLEKILTTAAELLQ